VRRPQVTRSHDGQVRGAGGVPEFGRPQVPGGAGPLEERPGEAPVPEFVDLALLADLAEDLRQHRQRVRFERVTGLLRDRPGDLGQLRR
jgi:hypothetical protein